MISEKTIYPKNRDEWRSWLAKNHDKCDKIAIIKYKKHTGKPSLTHLESMEEAICFGWIDTTIKRLDDERYIRRFSRRTNKSRWSKNTLSYAKRLISEDKMTPAGLKFYKEGLKKPILNSNLPKNPETPADLKKELASYENATEKFDNFPKSYKRMYLYWILRAKLPETRSKRIKEVVKRVLEDTKKWT